MLKHLKLWMLAVLFAAAAGYSHAGCITNDKWTGPDKTQHFVVGAGIGAAGTLLANGDWRYGVALGALAGGLKEYSDSRHPEAHTCSLQDFAVTVAGAAAGSYGMRLFIVPKRGGATIYYQTPLQ